MDRFFADDSFWNRPIGPQPAIDAASPAIIAFMAARHAQGLWLNLDRWTIPVYDIDASTPRRRVGRRLSFGGQGGAMARSAAYERPDHPLGFEAGFAADAAAGRIPIPEHARPDPEDDAHLAVIDRAAGWAWDMWGALRRDDGTWESKTGMKYRLDGSGVFDRAAFAVHDGESIHPYGPGRAAGVPIIAGLIMHHELLAGRIPHRLAFATQAAALQRFVAPPAAWTDGGWRGGLPEGATLQLDPALDLDGQGLAPAARTVARALQEYGAVCVDVAGGHTLYGEGLYADARGRSWTGLLTDDALRGIPLHRLRVLRLDGLVHEGQGPRTPDGVYAGDG